MRLSPTEADSEIPQLHKHPEASLLPSAQMDTSKTLKWLMNLISICCRLTTLCSAEGAYTRIAQLAQTSKVTHQHSVPDEEPPLARHLAALHSLYTVSCTYLNLAAMLASVKYEVAGIIAVEDMSWVIILCAPF